MKYLEVGNMLKYCENSFISAAKEQINKIAHIFVRVSRKINCFKSKVPYMYLHFKPDTTYNINFQ